MPAIQHSDLSPDLTTHATRHEDGGADEIDLSGLSGAVDLGSVDESILPDTDDTYDLGSTTKEIKDIYIDGVIYADEIDLDIGQLIYLDTDDDSGIYASADDTIKIKVGGSDHFTFGTYGRLTVATGGLGGLSIGGIGLTRYNPTTGVGLAVSGTSSIFPYNDDTCDLGKATLEWKDVFIDGVAYIDTLNVEVALNLEALDINATGLGSVTAVIPVTAESTTLYIALYDSYS